MNDAAPIDIAALGELLAYVKGRRRSDFAFELLEVYERSAGKDARALQAAIGSGDLDRVAFYSHRLKGSSSNVGARALSDRCHSVHLAAMVGDLARVRDAGAPLLAMMDATLGALRIWCAEVAAADRL